jgi:hypothetical protein
MALSGQIHIPAALPPWKNSRNQLNMWPDRPKSRSGRFEKEESLLLLLGFEARTVLAVGSCITDNATAASVISWIYKCEII